MAALKMYRQEIRLLSKKEVSDRRGELLKDLNGNGVFSWKLWPKEMQAVFWKKPMGDTETYLSWRYSSSVMAVLRYCLQSGFCWHNIGPNRHKKRKKEPDK